MSGGGGGGGANEGLWTNFYDTLSQIRMYHAKFPNAARLSSKDKDKAGEHGAAEGADGAEGEVEALVAPTRGLTFSVEESFGTRVDMHLLHDRYINLPQFSRHTDYLTFLATFSALHAVPRERKLKAQPADYRRFVADLLEYLTDFHKRIRPLADVQVLRDMVREEFDKRWEAKDLPGWFDGATAAAAAAEHEPGAPAPAAAAAAAASGSDGAAAAAPADAAAAAADASNPLYCVACAKLFAKDSVFAAHLTGKKHKKNEEILAALNQPAAAAAAAAAPAADANASAEGAPNSGVAAAAAAAPAVSKVAAELRSLALLEYEVAQFAALLSPQIEATRTHLLKKQTRTFEEIAAEMEAAAAEAVRAKLALRNGGVDPAAKEAEEEEEEDAANAPLYNPLNLPLGFDGKPIPYWLYKLHGLNLKFDCEICGNFSYAGPRNFERHFTEWRHAYGMRALGIPNTKHFAHITKMADAQALFEKLKREGAGAGFRADDEEEYEDADGNVFNKRTFLELQKQGLV